MIRRRTINAVMAVLACSWIALAGMAVPSLFESQAYAQEGGNRCKAPPIPGTGCPATGNGCAGCTGTGFSCQSQPFFTCSPPGPSCTNGVCFCNAFSC